MTEIKVVTMGAAEYHIPVGHEKIAAEAGQDAVRATVTVDTRLGAHETFDSETGELIDVSEAEE